LLNKKHLYCAFVWLLCSQTKADTFVFVVAAKTVTKNMINVMNPMKGGTVNVFDPQLWHAGAGVWFVCLL
jgi:hypothetical protein